MSAKKKLGKKPMIFPMPALLVGMGKRKEITGEKLRRIAGNAGIDGSIALQQVRESKGNIGLNAATESYEDLLKAGIIDPTKVVRTALQNAASIASNAASLLSTASRCKRLHSLQPRKWLATALPTVCS